MANYTISQITLPNGDVCYLKDANPVTELPSVTGANDGEVLIVQNGSWTAGEINVETATLVEIQSYLDISTTPVTDATGVSF